MAGANSKNVSYNAIVVKFFNAKSSLVRLNVLKSYFK
jgi:hypothetical protein